MSDSFVQGSGGGTKLDITNSIESSVNAMVDIPANSFVFSPKIAQFCKGYCSDSTTVGVGTLTNGSGYTSTDKHYWVSIDKVVSIYKASSYKVGVAVTNVTRDAKGAIISVSTTVLNSSISLGGNLVGVAQLTPTLFACVGYYSGGSYYIALQFNSDYSSVSVGSLVSSTDYINNSSTVVVKRLSSSRFFVMFANSSTSSNTDSFSIHVYNVSGTTVTKWAYGSLWGDDKYGMTYNAMVVDENRIVVLRSYYAPLLVDFSSGGNISGLTNTSGSCTVLPTGTEFEYNGITYLIYNSGGDTGTLYFQVAKFEGSTYTFLGSFSVIVPTQFNPNAVLNGRCTLVDVHNKRLLIGFTCSDSNAGAYKGDYVMCIDLDSAINLQPIVTRYYVCNRPNYAYGIAHIGSKANNGVGINNFNPEFSTIAFSSNGVIIIMNIPVIPDVNLSCSGELIGVTTSKISSGYAGPCLIPSV